MARDYGGFTQGRKKDSQGRPLKIMNQPLSEHGRKEWDRIFGKKKPRSVEVPRRRGMDMPPLSEFERIDWSKEK